MIKSRYIQSAVTLTALFLSTFALANENIQPNKHFLNIDGPNCLNATMVFTGLSKTYRYASNGEMQTILKSPLCRRLANGEARRVNDIGIILDNGIYAKKDIISHSFVHIDNGIAFEKHGSSRTEPYQTVALSQIYQDYQLSTNPACQQNQFDRTACSVGTDYYRCENFEQFLTEKTPNIRKFTISFFREIETIELKLQDYIDDANLPKNKNKFQEIIRDLQVLSKKAENIPSSDLVEENLVSKMIAHRLVSIAGQLNAMGHPELRSLVWQWENQDTFEGKDIRTVFEIVPSINIHDDLDRVYLDVISKFTTIYAPIVKANRNVGLDIKLDQDFSDSAGSVSLYKTDAQIAIGINFHRSPKVTTDAYMAMLCHEVGHVLGGAPYSENTLKRSPDWESDVPSSSEGQSDYFSSLTCMKKVFAADPKTSTTEYDVTPKVKTLCQNKFANKLDQKICHRSVKAGFDLMLYIASVYEQFGPNSNMPRANMDITEAKGASVGHLYPSLQCRFDTILAGALNQPQANCWFVSK